MPPKSPENPPSFRDFIKNGTERNLLNQKSYQKVFQEISELLLNHTVLFIDQKRYKITEIEFYVNDFKYHLDTFASSHHITLENTKGKWLIRTSGVEITIGKAL